MTQTISDDRQSVNGQSWTSDPKCLTVGIVQPDDDFAARLKEAVEYSGKTQEQIEKDAGAGKGYVSRLLNRERVPGIVMVEDLARALGVRAAWLAFGDGPRSLAIQFDVVTESQRANDDDVRALPPPREEPVEHSIEVPDDVFGRIELARAVRGVDRDIMKKLGVKIDRMISVGVMQNVCDELRVMMDWIRWKRGPMLAHTDVDVAPAIRFPSFAVRLRFARQVLRGWGVAPLAAKAGVGEATIRQMEKGDVVKRAKVALVTKALGVTAAWIGVPDAASAEAHQVAARERKSVRARAPHVKRRRAS